MVIGIVRHKILLAFVHFPLTGIRLVGEQLSSNGTVEVVHVVQQQEESKVANSEGSDERKVANPIQVK